MFREEIGEEYLILQAGTSEGTQIKYKKGDYWYKADCHGREGLVEYLASEVLSFSDLDSEEYVSYEQGTVNGKPGCRSRNFLSPEDEFLTFYRLYYNEFGRDLSEVTNHMETMEERIEYVIRFIRQSCGLDVTDYLKKIFTLDLLILNEDRHFNNLGLVFRKDRFECAPIFDNGISLLTANQSVNRHFSIAENVKRVTARPFSGSHEKMFQYFGLGFHLDCTAALEWLKREEPSQECDVLAFQVERYQGIF
ncbi:MAG: hypothetical protein LUD01_11050 [Clostridiales bacterium]|nr:hypothetical protein [Clostridiales bacterium]